MKAGHDLDRLREMADMAKRIERSLDNRAAYSEPSLVLSRDCAAKHAGRLAAWLDDMLFIAEAERTERSPAQSD